MLALALDYPWEKWAVFLHPSQKAIVEKKFNGPARVSGSAGTGKTIVALHRAVFLARQDHEARILLTTFSDPLARNLEEKLRILCRAMPRLRERIEVASLNSVALRLAKSAKRRLASSQRSRLARPSNRRAGRHRPLGAGLSAVCIQGMVRGRGCLAAQIMGRLPQLQAAGA